MRKGTKALLIPMLLLAMLLAGCKTGEELVIPTRDTPVVIVTSTTFAPSQNSLAEFQQWLDGVEVTR